MTAPKWMLKHPTRWQPDAYTDEDRAEWEAADK